LTPGNPNNNSWCEADPCPNGFTANERFTLDRHINTIVVPPGERNNFSWQWGLVSAVDLDEQIRLPFLLTLDIGEGISFGEETNEQQNLIVDVDYDFKEERILEDSFVTDGYGVIRAMQVIDNQEGDMDFTFDTSDYRALQGGTSTLRPPGFTNDVAFYTRVRDGTFLQIDEGNQIISSIQKKNHVDIIQREMVISNDTERFCTGGSPTGLPMWAIGQNPVEACSPNRQGCFLSGVNDRTCMVTDPTDLRIFVRSRVLNQFGRIWVTDVSNDDYINFIVQ